jgi:hypothetical protein
VPALAAQEVTPAHDNSISRAGDCVPRAGHERRRIEGAEPASRCVILLLAEVNSIGRAARPEAQVAGRLIQEKVSRSGQNLTARRKDFASSALKDENASRMEGRRQRSGG